MLEVLLPAVIPYPQFDPVALYLGPIWVRWYGLAYVAGLLLGWYYVRRLVLTRALWGGVTPPSLEQIDSLLLWVMAGVIIGGRVFNAVLYDPAPYLADPLEIFRTWRGGMSFHGGVLGVVLALIVFARWNGLSFFTIGDLTCAAVPVGLFFGRIANFVNGELWGRVADVPWAMVFPDPGAGGVPRHPSQLYEAGLEGLALGLVLWWLVTRRGALARPGLISGVFLVGYALARGFCELFREGDSTWFFTSGFLTSGMLYSIPMVVVGIWLIWNARRDAVAA